MKKISYTIAIALLSPLVLRPLHSPDQPVDGVRKIGF
jgi:hypothetical protein